MPTLTISLPETLREFIEQQMKSKGYADISDYVREAQQAESSNRLEGLLLEGLESGGDDIEVDAEFWTDLKTDVAALVAAHKQQR
jgi:antitoxin ParD1/3/4